MSTRTDPATDLEERYGTGSRLRIDKRIGVTLAVIMVGIGVAFLAFGGLPSPSTEVEYRDLAHEIVDDQHASLTYEVTGPANAQIACAVQALNPSYAPVGFRLVDLPVTDERTRTLTESLVTTNRATTITVEQCWVRTD